MVIAIFVSVQYLGKGIGEGNYPGGTGVTALASIRFATQPTLFPRGPG